MAEGAAVPKGVNLRVSSEIDMGERKSMDARAKPSVQSKRGREPRSAAVRKRILEAALDRFSARGFDGASTREIAKAAGVSGSLLLYHFGSKDALWDAMMTEVVTELTGNVEASLAKISTLSAADGLKVFVEQYIRFAARNPRFQHIMSMQSNQNESRLAWFIDEHLRHFYDVVCDLISRGQREGFVRAGDPSRLFYLVVGAGGLPYRVDNEYLALTGRNPRSEAEIFRHIAFMYDTLFTN